MSSPAETAEPWEQRIGESSKAYHAFLAYRDLGLTRSLDKAGELIFPRKPGAQKGRKRGATGRVREWAAEFEWKERAVAWDAHQSKVRQKATEDRERAKARRWVDRREEQLERSYKLGVMYQETAETVLSFPMATTTVKEDPEGKSVTIIQPVDVLDRYRGARIGALGTEVSTKAIEKAIEVTQPKTKSPAESVTDEHLSGAEGRLVAWRRGIRARLAALSDEPPDDEVTDGGAG